MFAFFRPGIILCCAAAAAYATAAETTSSASKKTNVIIIVADDQGYHDLGVQGAKDIKTPNIDALAAGGVRFTQGYVTCPVCSPSRAGLLTGRYQEHFGHEFNPGPEAAENFGLPTDQKTLANYMKEAGYATGAIGKWHLGSREDCRPNRRGFDEYFGFLGGAHSYIPLPPARRARGPIYRNNQQVDPPPYLTYAFNEEAVSFIDRHKDQPFFLYLAYNAIHTPLQPAPGKEDKFAGIMDPKRHAMATMLAALDEGVGAIQERLKQLQLEDNTFVFYMSDNGGPTYGNSSLNTPLRGFKGETLEGGIRVPMIARWPGHLPQGTTYDKPVISLDVLPTVLSISGLKASTTTTLDGLNLLPYLAGKNSARPHEQLFWRFGNQFAAHVGDWKLVQTRGESPKLYNLAQDIGEEHDLAPTNVTKAQEVRAAYDKWNALNITPLWRDSRTMKKEVRPRASDTNPTGPKPGRKRGRRAGQMTSGPLEEEDE